MNCRSAILHDHEIKNKSILWLGTHPSHNYFVFARNQSLSWSPFGFMETRLNYKHHLHSRTSELLECRKYAYGGQKVNFVFARNQSLSCSPFGFMETRLNYKHHLHSRTSELLECRKCACGGQKEKETWT